MANEEQKPLTVAEMLAKAKPVNPFPMVATVTGKMQVKISPTAKGEFKIVNLE